MATAGNALSRFIRNLVLSSLDTLPVSSDDESDGGEPNALQRLSESWQALSDAERNELADHFAAGAKAASVKTPITVGKAASARATTRRAPQAAPESTPAPAAAAKPASTDEQANDEGAKAKKKQEKREKKEKKDEQRKKDKKDKKDRKEKKRNRSREEQSGTLAASEAKAEGDRQKKDRKKDDNKKDDRKKVDNKKNAARADRKKEKKKS